MTDRTRGHKYLGLASAVCAWFCPARVEYRVENNLDVHSAASVFLGYCSCALRSCSCTATRFFASTRRPLFFWDTISVPSLLGDRH